MTIKELKQLLEHHDDDEEIAVILYTLADIEGSKVTLETIQEYFDDCEICAINEHFKLHNEGL